MPIHGVKGLTLTEFASVEHLVVFRDNGAISVPLSVHLNKSVAFVNRHAQDFSVLREEVNKVTPRNFSRVYVAHEESGSLQVGILAVGLIPYARIVPTAAKVSLSATDGTSRPATTS